jgi:tetratricopeptide (TPR) repeat protein
MPAILRATGVAGSPGPVRIIVEQADGRRVERLVDVSSEADAGAVDVLAATGVETPWWLQSRGRPYWLDSVPASRAVYVQLNASRQYNDEPMAAFVERLRRLLLRDDLQRVVLDLRRNDGGDSELTRPLLALLTGWEQASLDHGLFVLIGRATFSAAVVLAAELERYTGAVIVGEPTGGRPNQYGEIETFQLPHSDLTVSYSSWYFQTSDPWDARPWVTPDVTVDPTFEDFVAGRDRALEAALSYEWRTPALDATLIRVAREQGVDAALETYQRFRSAPEHRFADTEEALTELLVDLWRRDQVAASLPVALLVVEEYPNSFEAHENVGEIYADQGDVQRAVQHASESLRLNPRNGDALGVLRDICGDQVLTTFLTSDLATARGRTALLGSCDRGTPR